jgi:hypothetical protein
MTRKSASLISVLQTERANGVYQAVQPLLKAPRYAALRSPSANISPQRKLVYGVMASYSPRHTQNLSTTLKTVTQIR